MLFFGQLLNKAVNFAIIWKIRARRIGIFTGVMLSMNYPDATIEYFVEAFTQPSPIDVTAWLMVIITAVYVIATINDDVSNYTDEIVFEPAQINWQLIDTTDLAQIRKHIKSVSKHIGNIVSVLRDK